VIVLDVNVCLVALRQTFEDHLRTVSWLSDVLGGPEAVGIPDFVLASVLRLATSHRVFADPAAPEQVLKFCDDILAAPAGTIVRGGPGHWPAVRDLVLRFGLRADDIPDALLAGLVLERGAVLATFDRGFARFPGLRVRNPLDD
jgi:toxin-antitoxin system PIN domain toxin